MADTDEAGKSFPFGEEPTLHCPHLLICRSVWFDPNHIDRGFSLAGIRTHIVPEDGGGFPFRVPRLFAYAQLWGDRGDYHLRIRLVRIVTSGYDVEEEQQLGENGDPREYPMPTGRPVEVTGLTLIQEVAYPIGPLPFDESGLYEFQLFADELSEPIARERVEVWED